MVDQKYLSIPQYRESNELYLVEDKPIIILVNEGVKPGGEVRATSNMLEVIRILDLPHQIRSNYIYISRSPERFSLLF
ncbi:MAG: hypothetical protein QW818_03150 [Candidatus Aenigmatarchaeota archaeon]